MSRWLRRQTKAMDCVGSDSLLSRSHILSHSHMWTSSQTNRLLPLWATASCGQASPRRVWTERYAAQLDWSKQTLRVHTNYLNSMQCVLIRKYKNKNIHMRTCTHTHVCACVCLRVCFCLSHARTHTHTLTHTHTHTYRAVDFNYKYNFIQVLFRLFCVW